MIDPIMAAIFPHETGISAVGRGYAVCLGTSATWQVTACHRLGAVVGIDVWSHPERRCWVDPGVRENLLGGRGGDRDAEGEECTVGWSVARRVVVPGASARLGPGPNGWWVVVWSASGVRFVCAIEQWGRTADAERSGSRMRWCPAWGSLVRQGGGEYPIGGG